MNIKTKHITEIKDSLTKQGEKELEAEIDTSLGSELKQTNVRDWLSHPASQFLNK